MERTKWVMLLDGAKPRKHTVIFDSHGENLSEQFKGLVKKTARGDVMARVNARAMAKAVSDEKVVPYFERLGPGRFTCHPDTWRELSWTEKRRFKPMRA